MWSTKCSFPIATSLKKSGNSRMLVLLRVVFFYSHASLHVKNLNITYISAHLQGLRTGYLYRHNARPDQITTPLSPEHPGSTPHRPGCYLRSFQ